VQAESSKPIRERQRRGGDAKDFAEDPAFADCGNQQARDVAFVQEFERSGRRGGKGLRQSGGFLLELRQRVLHEAAVTKSKEGWYEEHRAPLGQRAEPLNGFDGACGRQHADDVQAGIARSELTRLGFQLGFGLGRERAVEAEFRRGDQEEAAELIFAHGDGGGVECQGASAKTFEGARELPAQPLRGVTDEKAVALGHAIFCYKHLDPSVVFGKKPVMFELAGTHFEKGILELRMEPGGQSGWRSWIAALGPIRGRLVSLVLFLTAGFLLYFQIPSRLAFRYWTGDPATAFRAQSAVVWGIVGVGIAFYGVVLALRKETVSLIVDRSKAQLRFTRSPALAFLPTKDSLASFKDVQAVKIFGPDKEPRTPSGYLEIVTPALTDPELRECRLQFMTDEQAKFYPLNLSRLMGIQPQGDWTDPDDEVVS
jgi:hypothetical protein